MNQGFGNFHAKVPQFEGTDYPSWKIKMQAHLEGIDPRVWEIVEDPTYEVLTARVGQEQIDQHLANSRARTVLFSSLSAAEFARVSEYKTARDIWNCLQNYHEGSPQVRARLFESYRREYELFVQLEGESLDAMFSRFQVIVNKLQANCAVMPYDDHARAMKLLYALDRKVWDLKVQVILESPGLATLKVDELFSKLKSSMIDEQNQANLKNPSVPTTTMALVSSKGMSSSSGSIFANSSPLVSLSSLVTVSEEQLECVGDDELALVISRFSRFHNNRMNKRRGGGPKDGCFECGSTEHYVANCPSKNKSSDKRDSYHKHSSGKDAYYKHKDKHRPSSYKHKSGGFDKEELKRKYLKKSKARDRAFLASLSDLDGSEEGSSAASSDDDEPKKKVTDKLSGLCFYAEHGGYCTMALEGEVDDDDASEVPPTLDSLSAELESMNETLMAQDKLVKRAGKERNEYKRKYTEVLAELELVRAQASSGDATECDECALHMSSLASLQTKYAALLDEVADEKAKSLVSVACKSCADLRSSLAEKELEIAKLEKAKLVSTEVACDTCAVMKANYEACEHAKLKAEEENTSLRSILNWVSCGEPQLGMMMSQYKRSADSMGLGFAAGGRRDVPYGKVGDFEVVNSSDIPSTSSTTTPGLLNVILPNLQSQIVKDGVIEEPPKQAPQKQVWIPKPSSLRNPLDTLPDISSEPLPKNKPPPKANNTYKKVSQQPPTREVRYHCEYCDRDGHLVEYCFRRKRDERKVFEAENRNRYRTPHRVYVPPVERRDARPRGVLPQGGRPQGARPRGGRARRGWNHDQYGFDPRVGSFQSHTLGDPRFSVRDGYYPRQNGYNAFTYTPVEHMGRHWYSSCFTNPSVGPYAHNMSYA